MSPVLEKRFGRLGVEVLGLDMVGLVYLGLVYLWLVVVAVAFLFALVCLVAVVGLVEQASFAGAVFLSLSFLAGCLSFGIFHACCFHVYYVVGKVLFSRTGVSLSFPVERFYEKSLPRA